MYVFGGFNGQMLSDIQKLTPGKFCLNTLVYGIKSICAFSWLHFPELLIICSTGF